MLQKIITYIRQETFLSGLKTHKFGRNMKGREQAAGGGGIGGRRRYRKKVTEDKWDKLKDRWMEEGCSRGG